MIYGYLGYIITGQDFDIDKVKVQGQWHEITFRGSVNGPLEIKLMHY